MGPRSARPFVVPARGLYLAERATPNDPASDPSAAETASAWRAGFPDDAAWAARLALAGVADDAALAARIAHPRAAGDDDDVPAWATTLQRAYAAVDGPIVPRADDADDAQLSRGALRLVAPLARDARTRLRVAAERWGADVAPLPAMLVRALAAELAGLAQQTVALELAVARLGGELTGETPAARAASFLRGFDAPERCLALLDEYAALARLLADRTDAAVAAGAEAMGWIATDLPLVRERLLGGEDPGALVDADVLGDAHDGGRRVLALGFASGARVVLKPRSLAVDAAYQGLLDALARHGLDPAPRSIGILDAGDRGWQEWVPHAGCETPVQVTRFFARLGAQLAVLHALRGLDFHHENVIAAGEHPVLVDLEGLLHPRLGGDRADAVDPLASENGMDCVLRCGLLPRIDVGFPIDITGVGRAAGPETEVEAQQWLGEGTDEVRLGAASVPLPPGHHRAALDGATVHPADHLAAIESGFAAAHDLLVAHADDLLADGGALRSFDGVEVRAILRPTKAYNDVLVAASHPDVLRDATDRERLLDVVWRGVRRRPDLLVAAPAELADLRAGDVPKVTVRPGGTHGHHHSAGRLPDLLAPHATPRPDDVRRLDARDRDRQLAFLRWSILGAPGPAPDVPASSPPPAPSLLLPDARAIGDRLALLALDGPAWLSPRPVEDRGWVVQLASEEDQEAIRALLDALDGRGDPRDALARLGGARLPEDPQAPPHDALDGGTAAVALELADRGDAAAARTLLDAAGRRGWRCAGPPGLELPGGRQGLAGIGLTLLAVAAATGR